MPLQLLTPPSVEPVTLDEAKAWLRVDTAYDDLLILGLVTAARIYAEEKTHRSLITQTWKLVLDSFPGPSLMGVPYGKAFSLPGHAIQLERPPVVSVTSINYLDMSSTPQVMPSTDYAVDLTSEPARVTPIFGKIWPINLPQIGSVSITYQAGYGTTMDTVPAGIKTWMMLRMGALYENREEVVVGSRIVVAELPYIDALLDPWVIRFF